MITKGTEGFDGEGSEKEGRRGRSVEVAKCLVVFQLVGEVTRCGRGGNMGGSGGMANGEVKDVGGRGKEGKKIRAT